MKKFLTIITAAILILFLVPTSFAYHIDDDLSEAFLYDGNQLFLTKPTNAGDINYFGDRITFTTDDDKPVKADDMLKPDDDLYYFDTETIIELIIVGDANADGNITAADARIVLRFSAKLDINTDIYEDMNYQGVDVNIDGKVNATDARTILRVAAKLDEFDEFEKNFKPYTEPTIIKYNKIQVAINPAYANKPEIYTPGFYGKNVLKVEKVFDDDELVLDLYLIIQSKENVRTLIDECRKSNAIIAAYSPYITTNW